MWHHGIIHDSSWNIIMRTLATWRWQREQRRLPTHTKTSPTQKHPCTSSHNIKVNSFSIHEPLICSIEASEIRVPACCTLWHRFEIQAKTKHRKSINVPLRRVSDPYQCWCVTSSDDDDHYVPSVKNWKKKSHERVLFGLSDIVPTCLCWWWCETECFVRKFSRNFFLQKNVAKISFLDRLYDICGRFRDIFGRKKCLRNSPGALIALRAFAGAATTTICFIWKNAPHLSPPTLYY